jgi:hypothetical protein
MRPRCIKLRTPASPLIEIRMYCIHEYAAQWNINGHDILSNIKNIELGYHSRIIQ